MINKPLNLSCSSMPPLEEYVEQIRGLWASRELTHFGVLHEELAEKLKTYLGAPGLALFCNGHMALELGIQALELSGEVITTPFTFASTTNAIVRNGLTPVFCDVDPFRFTIDPAKIEALITEKTTAIVAVHVYGIPCDTGAIEKVAAKHGLKVVYDGAHAFGTSWQGKSIAQYGDLTMISFHAAKVFHTIEGGGATFFDEKIGAKLRRLGNYGFLPGKEDAEEVGANAKLSEFHAAMGLCNLRYIDADIALRKTLTERYDSRLKPVKGLKLFPDLDGLTRNYAYYPTVLMDEFGITRDKAAEALEKQSINARKYFSPLTSVFKCFSGLCRGETPIAKDIVSRVLCLPLNASMTLEDVDRVCDAFLALPK